MHQNKELELAFDFIEKTDRNVFLTGKAGTGKTTFLHQLKMTTLKRMVVVAPTGVAAINAKGTTIHSFFQMPFGPILPNGSSTNSRQQRRFNKTKIDIIKSLDLVIIDEISMVRADLLDGIDQVLRRYKDRNKVFGGVQVLMIGDLQQLSPVVRPEEWQMLRPYYETVYFFSSQAFLACNAVSIELTHIYRQDNQEFISILNEIRNNKLSIESAKILNKRYDANFEPKSDEGYITLTTHNNRADAINVKALNKLTTKALQFTATIDGKFSEHAYPTFEKLKLKVGAQVMFIKNDSSPEKRYFNGKIGIITYMNTKEVTLQCEGDSFEIVTSRETWDNINYSLDQSTKEIKETVIGSFSQIPLRLAWAITIHKSQGLTFEKAIIDAEASFAHGQTYVALSRCKSLEGIVLKSPISPSSIITDATVFTFTQQLSEQAPNKVDLDVSQKTYQLNLLEELFNFYPLLYPVNRMLDIYFTNKASFQGVIQDPLEQLKDTGIVPLLRVSTGFKKQLNTLSEGVVLLTDDSTISDRINKAIAYFTAATSKQLMLTFKAIKFSCENTAVANDFEKHYQALERLIYVKHCCLTALEEGFDVSTYLDTRVKAMLQTPKKSAPPTAVTTLNHTDLLAKLRDLRAELAAEEELKHFQIFTQKSLFEMCDFLPFTSEQLLTVNGMGKVRVQKYGAKILETIKLYCETNNIVIPQSDLMKQLSVDGKQKKRNTKNITLELFKKGLTIAEIAHKRDLVSNTIQSHLVHFIPTGEVEVSELIDAEKYNKMKAEILKVTFVSLTDLKDKLGHSYTFSELRVVIADLKLK